MTDLDVQQDALDAAKLRLQSAASPVATSCLSFDGTGSPAVSGALAETESLLSQVLTALASTATKGATDAASIASTFTAADKSLAKDAS